MDRLNRNLHVILKFSKRSKTPGITFRNMPFSEANQLFACDFYALLDEIHAGIVPFTKKWN